MVFLKIVKTDFRKQVQILGNYLLSKLDPDLDLLVKIPDPDQAKDGSDRIQIRNTVTNTLALTTT